MERIQKEMAKPDKNHVDLECVPESESAEISMGVRMRVIRDRLERCSCMRVERRRAQEKENDFCVTYYISRIAKES